MEPLIFTIEISTLFAIAVMSVGAWFVGGWLVLAKVSGHGWHILIPLYNLYALFKAARACSLFWINTVLVVLAAIGWVSPWAWLSALVMPLLFLALVVYGWATIALAQTFGLKGAWLVFAFVLPAIFYVFLGVLELGVYDPAAMPRVLLPVQGLESRFEAYLGREKRALANRVSHRGARTKTQWGSILVPQAAAAAPVAAETSAAAESQGAIAAKPQPVAAATRPASQETPGYSVSPEALGAYGLGGSGASFDSAVPAAPAQAASAPAPSTSNPATATPAPAPVAPVASAAAPAPVAPGTPAAASSAAAPAPAVSTPATAQPSVNLHTGGTPSVHSLHKTGTTKQRRATKRAHKNEA